MAASVVVPVPRNGIEDCVADEAERADEAFGEVIGYGAGRRGRRDDLRFE
jgi:hypothetical protein